MNIDSWSRPDDMLDIEALDAMPAIEETELVRHIRLDKPLEMYIDGYNNKALIKQ